MSSELHQLYFPLTIPHPERLKRWHQLQGYADVEVKRRKPVSAVIYRIPAPHPAAVGKRLAFAADLHYRDRAPDRERLAGILRILTEYRPGYLLLGGDFSADAVDMDALPGMLQQLSAVVPAAFAVPGNWERGKSWIPMSLWSSICRRGGVEFLCNQSWSDDVFYFYGCDDLALGAPQLPRRWSGDKTNVLLVHRPDTVIAMDVADSLRGVALALCGHTHGGQIRLPFIGPVYASSRYGCALAYGQFERGEFGTRMIVSSGISNRSLRWRFNCRREVVLIEFTA